MVKAGVLLIRPIDMYGKNRMGFKCKTSFLMAEVRGKSKEWVVYPEV